MPFNPIHAFRRLYRLRAEKRLVGLRPNGLLIPQSLLFQHLQGIIDDNQQTLTAIDLQANQGALEIFVRVGVSVMLTLEFKIVSVDWNRRAVALEFSENIRSHSRSIAGRRLGGIVLAVFDVATGGENVKFVAADKPYWTIDRNRMTIHLAQIPSLQKTLNWGIGRFKLFDWVRIKAIVLEPERLRLTLGLNRPRQGAARRH